MTDNAFYAEAGSQVSSNTSNFLTIANIGAGFRNRDFTPVDIAELYLDRIKRFDNSLHSFLTVTGELALRQAQTAMQEMQANIDRGPLHGVPIGLKDIFATRGIRTTAHSRVLRDWIPEYDAAAWRRLSGAGAVLVGKLALHEFACGFDSDVPFPLARNPWDVTRLPGGSSSGAAAAVAAGLCPATVVSDTGGSSRIPASYCGIVGLKPTYGRISRQGMLPLAWSLDHVGIIAACVGDCALMLHSLAGHDPQDRTSSTMPVAEYTVEAGASIDGVRVGVPWENWLDETDAVHQDLQNLFWAALDRLRELGAAVTLVDGRVFSDAHTIQSVLLHCEGYAAHEAALHEHYELYGPRLRRRLLSGSFLSSADYLQACRARASVSRMILDLFADVDVIATPTQGQPPERFSGFDPDKHFNRLFTSPFNLTGSPAISVPCGFTKDGLPVGLQLAGRSFAEGSLLAVAQRYEEATPWHEAHPSLP